MGKKITEIIVEILAQAGVKRSYNIVGDALNLFAEIATRNCAPVVLIACPRCSTSVERRAPRRADSRFM
jgi:actin-like ATPase involved in cell morphogenesis